MAAAAPLRADRGHARANVANRDRGRDYSRAAPPSDTPGRITDGHLSPKPIPTILSDATAACAMRYVSRLLLMASALFLGHLEKPPRRVSRRTLTRLPRGSSPAARQR